MKIFSITETAINFDNGMAITYGYENGCCEWNYADFKRIDSLALNMEFDPNSMKFEAVPDLGFRFGSEGTYMFFIPCYSFQNGYYSTDIQIYWNGKEVLSFVAKWENDY